LRRAQTVAVAHLQNFMNVDFAHLVERKRLPDFVSRQPRRAMLQLFWKIAEVDEIAGGSSARSRNHILEFADIAGLGMLEQDGLRAAGKPGDILL
jgi:hypothetical protein